MAEIVEETIPVLMKDAFWRLKAKSREARTESLNNRKVRLSKLREWIHSNRSSIHQAMFLDFQKAAVEVDGTEIFHVLNEIKHALNEIERWVKPKKVDAPITLLGTRSYIQYEPRGVCLIISPWNYPFSLAVGPMVSALAAGNLVILKPSELTPHVSALITEMTIEVFSDERVVVFEGGPEVSQKLLALPFDHIFFTGSPAIGKLVMKAAAENLTSVTLELGGKSPAIITASANLTEAAERTAVGKFINNGQTCIAPDYVLVDETIINEFTQKLKEHTQKRFTVKNESFEQSKSYCRIVNQRHFNRLNDLLQDALNAGAKLQFGGEVDASTRFMHPVILTDVPLSSRILAEEIFGPILPVIPYKNLNDAVSIINSKQKPLALYIFTRQKKDEQKVLSETSAGGMCINDCAIHFLHHNLPFGGVNNSGIGKSHGYYGFLAFSNEKPVLKQKSGFTSVKAFYPPYTSWSKTLMDWFLKLF